MQKILLNLIITLSFSLNAHAESTLLPGNIAIHIANVHYEHPVRLLHPYLDYWHMKGPLAEIAALISLNKRFAHVQLCKQAQQAEVVLSIEPHLFYNPQMRIFHAEFIVKGYTQSSTNVLADTAIFNIKKQVQQTGELSHNPQFYIQKAYIKAMDEVVNALVHNQAFLSSLNLPQAKNVETICPMLDELHASKLYY